MHSLLRQLSFAPACGALVVGTAEAGGAADDVVTRRVEVALEEMMATINL